MKDHTKSQISEISEKFYNEFLALKANKDQILKNLEPFYSCNAKEDVSTICLNSMAMLSDDQSGENASIDLDLQILTPEQHKENEREFSRITLASGDIYHGYLNNGKPDGFGGLESKIGLAHYVGEFREVKKHGKGFSISLCT